MWELRPLEILLDLPRSPVLRNSDCLRSEQIDLSRSLDTGRSVKEFDYPPDLVREVHGFEIY